MAKLMIYSPEAYTSATFQGIRFSGGKMILTFVDLENKLADRFEVPEELVYPDEIEALEGLVGKSLSCRASHVGYGKVTTESYKDILGMLYEEEWSQFDICVPGGPSFQWRYNREVF